MNVYETALREPRPLRMMTSPAIAADGRTAQEIVRAVLAQETGTVAPAVKQANAPIAAPTPDATQTQPTAPEPAVQENIVQMGLARLADLLPDTIARVLRLPQGPAAPIHAKMAIDPFDRLAAQVRAHEG